MDRMRLGPSPKSSTAIILLATGAVSVGAMQTVGAYPGADLAGERWVMILLALAPLMSVAACVLLFYRPRLAYGIGMIAGMLGLASLIKSELAQSWCSWSLLNYEPFDSPAENTAFRLGLVMIMAVALTVIATTSCLIRLLPAQWFFRGSSLRNRTWPALVVAGLVIGAWFAHSATPYTTLGYDHPAGLEFRILHIEKTGLHFGETTIGGSRDGKIWISRAQRRLFQYRFEGHLDEPITDRVPSDVLEKAKSFVASTELWSIRTPPPHALRSWNAEGWYVVLKDSKLLAFTTENGTVPPPAVAELFREVRNLPTTGVRLIGLRDICFGFCYDPIAALGFTLLPQRARLLLTSNE